MGFLQKLFGAGKSAGVPMPSSAGGRISLHKMALMQNFGVTPKRCDVCGSTFAMPGASISVLSDDVEGRYSLDVGGYCVQCRKFMCQKHAKFVKGANMGPISTYEVGCDSCGSPLKATK